MNNIKLNKSMVYVFETLYIQPFYIQPRYTSPMVLWLRWQSACLVSRRSRVRVSLGPIWYIKFCCLYRNMFTIQTTPTTLFSMFGENTRGWRYLLINKARNMFPFSINICVKHYGTQKLSYFDLQSWIGKI